MIKKIARLCFVLALAGCVGISPEQRASEIDVLAHQHGWQLIKLSTSPFVLVAYAPKRLSQTVTLTVYIEGDGLAWVSRSQPSANPTPVNPIGLKLAMQHPTGSAVYLARPCQYVEGPDARNCSSIYWIDRRFSPEVIESTNMAIEQLKQRYKANKLELIGYSGGGAVAALVAAKRSDVVNLVTVVGNLDHAAWTKLHSITPLKGSLNPADAWNELIDVPQLHFVGSEDKNVSPDVARSYQARFPENRQPLLRLIEGFDHVCCWVEHWPQLYFSSNINK